MDISLDDTLESSDSHSNCLDNSSQNTPDANLSDSLRVSANNSQMTTGRRRGLENYVFQGNNRDSLPYKVVQVATSNSSNQQSGLNIISASDFHNFMSSENSINTDSAQADLVTSSTTSSNTASISQPSSKLPYFPNTSRTSTNEQSSSSQEQSQFYLLMSPQDMVGSQASKFMSRNQFDATKNDDGRVNPTRRVQHNEVERRRRDKINTWIMKLASIVPTCASDHSKQGQSKGGILAKACDYVQDLQSTARQCEGIEKKIEQLQFELRVARLQLKDQKQENEILHQTLRDHGLSVDVTARGNT